MTDVCVTGVISQLLMAHHRASADLKFVALVSLVTISHRYVSNHCISDASGFLSAELTCFVLFLSQLAELMI